MERTTGSSSLVRMERTTGFNGVVYISVYKELSTFNGISREMVLANNRLVVFHAWSEQPARRLSRMERTTGSSSFAHGANNRLVVFRAWSEQPAPLFRACLFRAWSEQPARRLSRMERTTGSSSFAHGANNRLVRAESSSTFRAWSEQPCRELSTFRAWCQVIHVVCTESCQPFFRAWCEVIHGLYRYLSMNI